MRPRLQRQHASLHTAGVAAWISTSGTGGGIGTRKRRGSKTFFLLEGLLGPAIPTEVDGSQSPPRPALTKGAGSTGAGAKGAASTGAIATKEPTATAPPADDPLADDRMPDASTRAAAVLHVLTLTLTLSPQPSSSPSPSP